VLVAVTEVVVRAELDVVPEHLLCKL
jgi:hypothetical protein